MAFSLDNPGFLLESRENSVEAAAPDMSSQHSSTASLSTLSSAVSAHCNCPK